jgi:hypothetical protein
MNALVRRIRAALLALNGVVESGSAWGEGEAFWVNGKQIAAFHSDNAIELRITRSAWSANRERLKADKRVRRHGASSDWIDVQFGSPGDVAFVMELAELAASAHRARDGAMAKPPPVGADLARRRRFH